MWIVLPVARGPGYYQSPVWGLKSWLRSGGTLQYPNPGWRPGGGALGSINPKKLVSSKLSYPQAHPPRRVGLRVPSPSHEYPAMTRLLPLPVLLLLAAPAAAQTLTVAGGKSDLTSVVVTAPLPAGVAESINVVELPEGRHAAAQITDQPLLSDAKGKQITFVLPKLQAGGTVRVRPATLNYVKAPPHFRFVEKPGEGATDLVFDGRPVLRYFHAPHDASTPDKHYLHSSRSTTSTTRPRARRC